MGRASTAIEFAKIFMVAEQVLCMMIDLLRIAREISFKVPPSYDNKKRGGWIELNDNGIRQKHILGTLSNPMDLNYKAKIEQYKNFAYKGAKTCIDEHKLSSKKTTFGRAGGFLISPGKSLSFAGLGEYESQLLVALTIIIAYGDDRLDSIKEILIKDRNPYVEIVDHLLNLYKKKA